MVRMHDLRGLYVSNFGLGVGRSLAAESLVPEGTGREGVCLKRVGKRRGISFDVCFIDLV